MTSCICYCTDLCLCFRLYAKSRFSFDGAHIISDSIDPDKVSQLVDSLYYSEEKVEETPVKMGFLTRSDTNRTVQPQKMARGLKFRI